MRVSFLWVLLAVLAPLCVVADEAEPVRLGSGDCLYQWVPDWNQLPADMAQLGNTHGNIVIDKAGLVYVTVDGPKPILVYKPSGEFVRAFGDGFSGLHDIALVEENGEEFIVAAHLAGKQVVRFSTAGDHIWTIGWPKESGKYANRNQYNPTAVTVAPDGRIYVADGYGQQWVHIYDKDRNYVSSFGGRGKGNGQFQTCHGIEVDLRGAAPTLVVCDRENRRLQRFDLDGNYLGMLTTGLRRPCHIDFHGDRAVVAELEARVTVLDKNFNVIASFGSHPNKGFWARNPIAKKDWIPGAFTAPHGACFDTAGNLYVMDWNKTGRVSKLTLVE